MSLCLKVRASKLKVGNGMIAYLRGLSARLERLRSLLKHPTHRGQGQAEVLSDLGGGDACHKGRPNCLALPVLQCGGRLG